MTLFLRFYRKNVSDLKTQEGTLRRGLGIFKIEQQPSKDLTGLDKDLDYIEQVLCLCFRLGLYNNALNIEDSYGQLIE